MIDITIIDDMKARIVAPGLNMADAELMRRAVTFMETTFKDNCRLSEMVGQTQSED